MKHIHHIIPKHMGGTDDPSNLVELTIEEHAEAHRLLYEQHGHWQDKVAWQGLLGLIPNQLILQEMYAARKGKGNHMYGKPCYYKMTDEQKQQWKDNISKALKGRKQTKEWVEKRIPWKGNGAKNPRFGKEPWNKGKKGLQKQDISQLLKKSKPLIFANNVYISLNEAEKLTGISSYKISKNCNFITPEEYLKATSK